MNPKSCHICDNKRLVLYENNGVMLRIYRFIGGRRGKVLSTQDNPDDYTQKIGCFNCGFIYEWGTDGIKPRWFKVGPPQ